MENAPSRLLPAAPPPNDGFAIINEYALLYLFINPALNVNIDVGYNGLIPDRQRAIIEEHLLIG